MSGAEPTSLIEAGVKKGIEGGMSPDEIRILVDLTIEEHYVVDAGEIEVGGEYVVHGERVVVTHISEPSHRRSTPWVRVPRVTFQKPDQSTDVSSIYGAEYGYENFKAVRG